MRVIFKYELLRSKGIIIEDVTNVSIFEDNGTVLIQSNVFGGIGNTVNIKFLVGEKNIEKVKKCFFFNGKFDFTEYETYYYKVNERYTAKDPWICINDPKKEEKNGSDSN